MLVAQSVTRMRLTAALVNAPPGQVQERSIARRIERSLADPALDPDRLLPLLVEQVLPVILADLLRAHDQQVAVDARAHGSWFPLAVVVDETTLAEQVHILCVSLSYQGTALPLLVRTWEQNTTLTPGVYWQHLARTLQHLRDVFPPALQDHLVLVADRGYGVSRMVDTLNSLGWHWVLRVPGDRRVLLQDGRIVTARDLATRPGTARWGTARLSALLADDEPAPPAPGDAVAVFKDAGWRACAVVGSWLPKAKEPWLLITTVPLGRDTCAHYARRWGIERQFKAWKSQGFHLEDLQRPTPARVARVLTALVIATWWTVGVALAHLTPQLQRAAQPARQPPCPATRRPSTGATARRQLAARSLLTHGLLLLHRLGTHAPPPLICWTFPAWEAPSWSVYCSTFPLPT
jgi:hypothetical protein